MGEEETSGPDTRGRYEPMRIVHELADDDDPETTLQAAAMAIWDRVLDAAERLRETGLDEDRLNWWLMERENDVLGLVYGAMCAVEVARRLAKDPLATEKPRAGSRRRGKT
jgi:hypothetical protein